MDDNKFVTKKDLKKELAKFATKKDLENFGKRLEKKIDTKLDAKFEFKFTQLERNIDDKLSKWKDEIFNLVDGLAIEIRDGREHRVATSHQITQNRERIEKIEYKVFGAVVAG